MLYSSIGLHRNFTFRVEEKTKQRDEQAGVLPAACILLVCLSDLFFDPEGKGCTVLQNVHGLVPD
jgi:hypothetical protein